MEHRLLVTGPTEPSGQAAGEHEAVGVDRRQLVLGTGGGVQRVGQPGEHLEAVAVAGHRQADGLAGGEPDRQVDQVGPDGEQLHQAVERGVRLDPLHHLGDDLRDVHRLAGQAAEPGVEDGGPGRLVGTAGGAQRVQPLRDLRVVVHQLVLDHEPDVVLQDV